MSPVMITFIDYQYKGVGGVGQLVVNSTLELNRRGKRSKLYCSSESYEYRRLMECHATFDFIDSDVVTIGRLHKFISSNDVIVLTNIFDTPLLEKIKYLNNRMVFYSVHPDTFFCYPHQMDSVCNQKDAALGLVKCLEEHDSLYFMDWPNVKAIFDKGKIEIGYLHYLPIPVMTYSKGYKVGRYIDGSLNITYLGRGNDIWKIYPIIKVLEDLNSLRIKAKVTILTDDDSQYRKMIGTLVNNNTIKVDYILNLFGEELEQYLLQHSDLHIAMGTSALEGAKLGIPTILIDYSKKKFPDDYAYRWIYECVDFCLGGEIIDGVSPYKVGRPLIEMIKSISGENGYMREAEACRSYLEKNHSIQSFVDRLETACQNTKMTTRNYCKTRFSKNMYYILPVIIFVARIKNFIIKIKNNGL